MKHGNKKLNLKRLKKFGVLFTILFLLVSVHFIKTILIKNINSTEKISIRNICFSLSGINFKDIKYKNNKIIVGISNFKVKPSFIKNVFAFEGPGEIISEKDKKKFSIEGKIKGSIKNGNLDIKTTNIKIENIGDLRFYGIFENWGKEKIEGTLEFNGFKIKDILELTGYKLPFDGNLYGKIFVEKDRGNIKNIKFDLEVKDIVDSEKGQFNLGLKGEYIPSEKKGIIEEGLLKNEKGEKLVFEGFISEKEIELIFNTKEFSLDEVLKLLPNEIKKKYNLKIEASKIKLDKFNLNISKKKFLFLEIYCLKQILLESKI